MTPARFSKFALILVATLLGVCNMPATAQAQSRYLGQVDFPGFDFCPVSSLPADGRLLPISENAALFALLGTTYGGDGQRTFALPNLEMPTANPGAKLTPCITTAGIFPSEDGSPGFAQYVGEIFFVGMNFCPGGTALADGRLIPIAKNSALFSLFGTTYGGDGSVNFALPKLQIPTKARSDAPLKACVVLYGIFPTRPPLEDTGVGTPAPASPGKAGEHAPGAMQQDFADCTQTGDMDRSIAACTRFATDPDPSDADRALAYRWLGNDHVAGNALHAAIIDYSEAIKLDPGNAATYASRAIAFSLKGDRDAAIADYRQAAAIDPATVASMVAASTELKGIADASASAAPENPSPPVPPVAAATAPATPAASVPGRSYWSHNGSTVYLVANGASRELYYDKPRPGMVAVGARAGSLLFRGTYANGGYSGTAFIFTKHCGTLPYQVSGPVTNDFELITMHGDAPSADADCNVTKYISDTLTFALCVKTVPAGSDALLCP